MAKTDRSPGVIRIRAWPKVIFFYPTVVLAGIYSLIALVLRVDFSGLQQANLIFSGLFSINVLIFAFEFSVMMTIILLVIMILGGIILVLLNVMPSIVSFVGAIDIAFNNGFYYYYFLFFIFIFIIVWVRTRFNYWDVRHNEIFHRHGLLSDTQRINAPNLSYRREITDMLEYFLSGGFFSRRGGAGRIVLLPLNHEPFVLDTVLGIQGADRRLGEILSKLKVTVDDRMSTGRSPMMPER